MEQELTHQLNEMNLPVESREQTDRFDLIARGGVFHETALTVYIEI